jgi:hypothetical protein
MFVGDIPTSLGLHPGISLLIGVVLLYLLLRFMGQSADEAVPARATERATAQHAR